VDLRQHTRFSHQGYQPTHESAGLTQTGCLTDQSAIRFEQFVDSLEHLSWIVHQVKDVERHDRIVGFRLERRVEEIGARELRIADLSIHRLDGRLFDHLRRDIDTVNGLHAAGNTERLLPLLYSPAVLIITPRVYHKRLIKNPNVHIERERPLAFWRDWSFIIVMTLGIGYLAASMVWKPPPF
jgi:hypothetical protein